MYRAKPQLHPSLTTQEEHASKGLVNPWSIGESVLAVRHEYFVSKGGAGMFWHLTTNNVVLLYGHHCDSCSECEW